MTDATKMAIEALGGLIESVTGVDQVSLPHESGKTEGGAMKERRCSAGAVGDPMEQLVRQHPTRKQRWQTT